MKQRLLLCVLLTLLGFSTPAGAVTVGSKKFTESVILGEMACSLIRRAGKSCEHRRDLGGSQVLWQALIAGDIDVYPEYTGTLALDLLKAGGGASPSCAGNSRNIVWLRRIRWAFTMVMPWRSNASEQRH